MKELIYTLLVSCIQEQIPNPNTINNLPIHQKEMVLQAVEDKCYRRVSSVLNLEYLNPPMCIEKPTVY